jgi:hypothetical protein
LNAPLAGIGVGVNVFSESLDTLGTFTRTVADAALLAGVLTGSIPSTRLRLDRPPRLAGPTDADAHLLSVASWCEERLPFVGLG